MSIDSYFCFCCLSTNSLNSLFGGETEENYAKILQDLLCIKPSQEEYADDGYICEECSGALRAASSLKKQVFDTLNILEKNGLIKLKSQGNLTLIRKVTGDGFSEYYDDKEEKYKLEAPADITVEELLDAQDVLNENQIKTEQPNQKQEISLRREKRIIVHRKKRRQREKAIEPSYKVSEDLKCSVCGELQPNAHVYHMHMNKHFPNHVCDICGKGFLTEKRLKRHMPSHDKGPFRCSICDAIFDNYNTMNSHRQRKHSKVALYACPHCPERFGTFTRRAIHLNEKHSKSGPIYHCPLCTKKFLISGNLSSHMRNTHYKVRKHVCTECGASFYKLQDMQGHMATHTGRKEYQCQLCPKSYPRKNALEVHKRTHTGEKPFECHKCEKRFTQKCALIRHVKIHDRVQPDEKRIDEIPGFLITTSIVEGFEYI